MNTLNPGACAAVPNPKIYISGSTEVSIDPIRSISDLLCVSGKFGKIVATTPLEAVSVLSTAAGDLSASVLQGDSQEGLAEEAAAVIVAAAVIAAGCGVNSGQLSDAINGYVRDSVKSSLTRSIGAMLDGRINS